MRPDLLDPQKFPLYVLLSALVALAIGVIIYQSSGRQWLSIATGLFLFIADVISLWMLMGRKK